MKSINQLTIPVGPYNNGTIINLIGFFSIFIKQMEVIIRVVI